MLCRVFTACLIAATLSTVASAQLEPRRFKDAQVTVPNGPEKTKQIDAAVEFTTDRFQVLTSKGRTVTKSFPYASVTGAEYSYSKSPRWKSGLFISPFLFLSSGKKHWLLVKSADDYTLLRLDKGNYKLVIAELETRAKVNVEAQGDDK